MALDEAKIRKYIREQEKLESGQRFGSQAGADKRPRRGLPVRPPPPSGGPPNATPSGGGRLPPYLAMSLSAFSGLTFTTLRAGLAANTCSCLVNGLMPVRFGVAGL